MKFLPLVCTLCLIAFAPAFAQSEAVVTQVGDNLTVSLSQWTAGQALGSRATILQENGAGTGGHFVYLTQSGGSQAEIFQTGSQNGLYGVSEQGFGVMGSYALSAEGATLLLSQSGLNNLAFVDQAAGAYAEITQSGVGNPATVIQQ